MGAAWNRSWGSDGQLAARHGIVSLLQVEGAARDRRSVRASGWSHAQSIETPAIVLVTMPMQCCRRRPRFQNKPGRHKGSPFGRNHPDGVGVGVGGGLSATVLGAAGYAHAAFVHASPRRMGFHEEVLLASHTVAPCDHSARELRRAKMRNTHGDAQGNSSVGPSVKARKELFAFLQNSAPWPPTSRRQKNGV
jgi:hypothetical protein